ncbi:MAG: DUF885 domain-containing protein [Pseudomonadales bacterium]
MLNRLPVLLTTLLLALSVHAHADWIKDSDAITLEVLREQAKFVPEAVAAQGLADFDAEIFDARARVYQRQLDSNKRLIADLSHKLKKQKHPKIRQDMQILITALEDENETAQLERQSLLPYISLSEQLFGGFHALLDPRSDKARYPAALQRLRKYTGKAQGYEPITDLVKKRTEERFATKDLTGPYKKQVLTDLENTERYAQGMRDLFRDSGLQGWQADLKLLLKQLKKYNRWVKDEVLPRSREQNQLPEAIYANNLKNFGVYASPRELITIAQHNYQLLRNQMKAIARQIADQRGWQENDLISVIAALKKEQIPPEKILEVYQRRLASLEEIIRRENIITLPKRDANIRLASEAESAAVPAPFMSPPQLIGNTGQHGEFVLVQTNPGLDDDAKMDDWSHDAITWSLTVHEARPGHELQFASLVENGTSMARAIYAFNSANAEGWGLYSEALMQEFLPLEGQLFALFTQLMRAGRMFMDPMVNTGQMTPQQAVSFMTEQVGLSTAMANSEADRYSFRAPGQATSYYYGFINLMRLRTEVEEALGPKFNQRKFHDFILEQGLLPPDLLREAVLEHFVHDGKPK